MLQAQDIKLDRVSRIVAVGDLSGFSAATHFSNPVLMEEFIRRFYALSAAVIHAADGELVKFVGDGYFAVWQLSESGDLRADAARCRSIDHALFTLSALVRIASLDMSLPTKIILRQSVAVEPHATRFRYTRDGIQQVDYIGALITFAFRLQSIARRFPYLVAHKHFVDLANMYSEHPTLYKPRPISDDDVERFFKGVSAHTDAIFSHDEANEGTIDGILDRLAKRALPPTARQDLVDVLKDNPRKVTDTIAIAQQSILAHRLARLAESSGASWFRNTLSIFDGFAMRAALDIKELRTEIMGLEAQLSAGKSIKKPEE